MKGKIRKGGYVRIVKDGSFKEVDYKVGEIWKVVDAEYPIDIEKDGLVARVCVTDNARYGIEAEWIGMKLPENANIKDSYDIF